LTLLDLADRLLDRGVVLSGDATISVAGVDLVYLGLNTVLSSVDALERAGKIGPASRRGGRGGPDAGEPTVPGRLPVAPGSAGRVSRPLHDLGETPGRGRVSTPVGGESPHAAPSAVADLADPLDAARMEGGRVQGVLPDRVEVDPDGVERGLAKLVLTLVEFIRQLLERQAVRRMDGGGLSEEQVERMGVALQRLEEKVRELCGVFRLAPEELNITLGPLGDLL